jgi:hypothetical protein
MPVRFRKIIRITPWLKMNISKGGVSFTVGKPGYQVNLSDEGVKQTIGLPGTGISHQSYFGRDEDDDKKKENGNGNGHRKQEQDGREKSAIGEMAGVAGMAVLAEVLDHDEPKKKVRDDNDDESEPRKSRRRRRNAGERSSALRSTFILASILVFFVAGAQALGLIPADFFANLGHALTSWVAQLGG